MKTIKQSVMDAVITALSTITVANGYATDIGRNVELWHKQDLDEDSFPLTVVAETKDTITKSCGVDWHELSLEIVTFISASKNITAAVSACQADIRRCISSNLMLRFADESDSDADEAEYGLGERDIAACIVRCTASFNTRPNDAFTVGLEG